MPHKLTAIIILLLMLVGQIGTDVYLASLPAIHQAFHADIHLVQYTFSIFLAGFALSQLIYGPLSDRYGRKPFILFGLVLYSVAALYCSLSSHITEMLIARAVQGVGAGACTVIARATMRDVFDGKDLEKMNIYQSMLWSMVPISAPLLGSYIQQYLGWQYNFLFLMLISILLLIFTWIKLPETHMAKEQSLQISQILRDYKNILCNKEFLPYLIFSACVVSMFAVFNVSAPIIIQVLLKKSAVVYGWSVFSVAMAFALGLLTSRLLTNILPSEKLLRWGLWIIIFASMGFILISLKSLSSLVWFLLPMMLIQVGSAFSFPVVAAASMKPYTQKAGKAAAIFGCTLFLGSALTSGIMSHLHENSFLPLVILIALLTIIMILSYLAIIHLKCHES